MSDKMAQRSSKISDEVLAAAVAAANVTNMRQLLRALGLAAYGGNYEVMRGRLARQGLLDERFAPRPRQRWLDVSQEELARVAAHSISFAEMLDLLRVPWSPVAHRQLKVLVERFGTDTSHFLGQASNRGRKFPGRATPLEQVLVAGRLTATKNLKKRLLAAGLLDCACAMCGRDRWNDEPIPLELDHINGDRTDNRLENLRLLCPNCHAQTPTYRGRNIGRQPGMPLPAPVQTVDQAAAATARLRSLLPVAA
jgi:hypothetical protein